MWPIFGRKKQNQMRSTASHYCSVLFLLNIFPSLTHPLPYPTSVHCRYLQQVPLCYRKQPSKSLELPSVTRQFYTWASAYRRNAAVFIFPCWDLRVENILSTNKNYKLIATESLLPLWLLFTVIFYTISRVSIMNQVPYFYMQRSHISRPNNVNTPKWHRTFTELILNHI